MHAGHRIAFNIGIKRDKFGSFRGLYLSHSHRDRGRDSKPTVRFLFDGL